MIPPDKVSLSGPRVRVEGRNNPANKDGYKRFKEKNPGKNITQKQYKDIITAFNLKVAHYVAHTRDGVELPYNLGFLWGAACGRAKVKKVMDSPNSVRLNQFIRENNQQTDGNLGKVIYTNYGTKYHYKFREYWRFKTSRYLSRLFSKEFRDNYLMFVHASFRFKTYKSDYKV